MDDDEQADQAQHDAGKINGLFLAGRKGKRLSHAGAR